MRLLKIKNIEKDFYFEAGKIYDLNIENGKLLFQLVNALINNDDDYIVYSEKGNIESFEKYSLLITSAFDIDPNSKKILNALYKKISVDFIDLDVKDKIQIINEKIIDVLDELSQKLDTNIIYECDLDIIKLLSAYNFCFNSEISNNYLEKIVTYIKANLEIKSIKYIIGVNILSFISDDEIDLFKKELEMLDLTLINLRCSSDFKNKNIEFLTIDNDLCEF